MTPRVTKGASARDNVRSPALFYGSAREAMLDFLHNLPDAGRQGVLLPGYIGWSPNEGSGVFDPVRDSGRPFGFYGLNDDLTADVAGLEALAESGRFRVLLVIHYFGRVEPRLAEIAEIARRHDMVLVEDLAHGLFTSLVTHGAGTLGDVGLYSLHKMLPTGTGGFAIYRDHSLLAGQAATSPQHAAELASYDLVEIARRRRSNFDVLTQLLAHADGVGETFNLLWPDLRADEVPQSLPVTVTGSGRDEIYRAMNADGFGMVSLYHTLIPELEPHCPRMHWLSRHIINFPIHQDVVEADLGPLARRFLLAIESHG